MRRSFFFAELWSFIYVIDTSDCGRFPETSEVFEFIKADPMMTGKPFVILQAQITENAIRKSQKRLNI
jgi:hypothetical protein